MIYQIVIKCIHTIKRYKNIISNGVTQGYFLTL
jgi:hypothetical protein